jgi:hypothetical protein
MRQLFTCNIPAQILATNLADAILGTCIVAKRPAGNMRRNDAERIVPKPMTDRKGLRVGDVECGTAQRTI